MARKSLEEGTNLKPKDFLGAKDIKTFSLSSTEECLDVINYVKHSPALVFINTTDKAIKQRIIDVLCGAVTALSLGICQIDKNNFLIIKK